MNPLNLKLTVPADRKLTIQLPDDIEPGDETVVTVIVRSTGLWISRQVIRELLVQLSRTPHQEYKPADTFAAIRTLEKH